MPRSAPRASSSARAAAAGLTLVELLVTLLILSILAAAAVPYAAVTLQRNKELELRRALREVRSAIDAFHEDWTAARISKLDAAASEDGYPTTLEVLVKGVDRGDAQGGKRRYLRRVPRDPFADPQQPPSEQWVLRGYQDEPDTVAWNRRDVYDLRSASEAVAIDGTRYRDW